LLKIETQCPPHAGVAARAESEHVAAAQPRAVSAATKPNIVREIDI